MKKFCTLITISLVYLVFLLLADSAYADTCTIGSAGGTCNASGSGGSSCPSSNPNRCGSRCCASNFVCAQTSPVVCCPSDAPIFCPSVSSSTCFEPFTECENLVGCGGTFFDISTCASNSVFQCDNNVAACVIVSNSSCTVSIANSSLYYQNVDNTTITIPANAGTANIVTTAVVSTVSTSAYLVTQASANQCNSPLVYAFKLCYWNGLEGSNSAFICQWSGTGADNPWIQQSSITFPFQGGVRQYELGMFADTGDQSKPVERFIHVWYMEVKNPFVASADGLITGSITVPWIGGVGGADSYYLLIGTDPAITSNRSTDPTEIHLPPGAVTNSDFTGSPLWRYTMNISYQVPNLNPGTTYYWRLRTSGTTITAYIPGPPRGFIYTPPPSESPYIDLWWTGSSNADSYQVFRNGTAIASNLTQLNYRDTDVLPSTNYTYKIRAINPTGSLDSNPQTGQSTTTLACAIPPPPAPTVTLDATSPIPSGASTTLSWKVAGSATSCTRSNTLSSTLTSGSWNVTDSTDTAIISNGDHTTSLTLTSTNTAGANQTNTFKIKCKNAGGESTEQSVVVTVNPPAPTVTLTADPSTIFSGASTKLTWTTTNNPTSCTATGEWTGAKAIGGGNSDLTLTNSLNNGLHQNKTFTITCINEGGSSGPISATVRVNPPAPTVTKFVANPTSILSTHSTTLTWRITGNALSCTPSNSGDPTIAFPEDWSSPLTGGDITPALDHTRSLILINPDPANKTKTFTIFCSNDGGSSATRSADVIVRPLFNPWIKTRGGDVHSNVKIYTPGGP